MYYAARRGHTGSLALALAAPQAQTSEVHLSLGKRKMRKPPRQGESGKTEKRRK